MPTRSIPIHIGGKDRQLRFDWAAFEAVEKELGYPVFDIIDRAGPTLPFRDVRVLIWAGLRHEDGILTLANTESWFTMDGYINHVVAIKQAINAAFKRDDDEKNVTSQVEKKGSSPGKTS